jgi:hypothetical protein
MGWHNWISLRKHFDALASDYDRLRPAYPAEFFQWILEKTTIRQPAELFDVGAGTGLCSLPFAEQGFSVVAIEASAAMCNLLKLKTASLSNYLVTEGDFDSLDNTSRSRFALAICGTAFHWLDPKTRLPRLRQRLIQRGWLCLVWQVFEDDSSAEFIRRSLDERAPSLELQRSPVHKPLEIYSGVEAEVVGSGEFEFTASARWQIEHNFSSSQLVQLLSTYTSIRALPEEERTNVERALYNETSRPLRICFRTQAFLFRASN